MPSGASQAELGDVFLRDCLGGSALVWWRMASAECVWTAEMAKHEKSSFNLRATICAPPDLLLGRGKGEGMTASSGRCSTACCEHLLDKCRP